jgi:hypothetical protein
MPTLKLPALTEYELGPRGWKGLYEAASQSGRAPEKQWNQFALFGLGRWLAGEDVELNREQREALLHADDEPLAAV